MKDFKKSMRREKFYNFGYTLGLSLTLGAAIYAAVSIIWFTATVIF